MNLFISFSGRKNGNCDHILRFISTKTDTAVYLREKSVHACCDCGYECFEGICKYRNDDAYGLYESMLLYDKVVWIVPMYCGNPSSLYFKFLERSQDYFMHNEERYESLISRLYFIGIYGDSNTEPDFLPCFEKWFSGSQYRNRVLGIERHRYGQKMGDQILDVKAVRDKLEEFLK